MFLEEHDLQAVTPIDALEARYREIEAFTHALFEDMDEAERTRHEAIKQRFEVLKITLFQNSDHILSQAKHPDSGTIQKALREAQLNMMFDWEQFGLTEDMFFKLYQCHLNQLIGDADLKARAAIIQQILAIETNLTLLFKVRQLTP
jgi:helix-turn-helix protein